MHKDLKTLKQLHKKYKHECDSLTSSHKIILVRLTCNQNQFCVGEYDIDERIAGVIDKIFLLMSHKISIFKPKF